MTDEGRGFTERPNKLARLPAHLASQLRKAIEGEYRQTLRGDQAEAEADHFRVKDMARRLDAGTGSLGLERYYVLIEGRRDHFVAMVATLALSYADCVRQDYHTFLEGR